MVGISIPCTATRSTTASTTVCTTASTAASTTGRGRYGAGSRVATSASHGRTGAVELGHRVVERAGRREAVCGVDNQRVVRAAPDGAVRVRADGEHLVELRSVPRAALA